MKGIVLAGGTGSRLFPITMGTSKQLLPIYNKPMIYYPISFLMLADIRELLIITTPTDKEAYRRLLGDGTRFGMKFQYTEQAKPEGLAQAFILGESFIGNEAVALVLGDNFFFGPGFSKMIKEERERCEKDGGATLFAHRVDNPEQFEVVALNEMGRPVSIVQKPERPQSRFAVTGLYMYDSEVVKIAKEARPSERGELEITAINESYLKQDRVRLVLLGKGYCWLDAGTPETLLEAAQFVETIERRQGFKVACLEEIAYDKGWIGAKELKRAADRMGQTEYGAYLNKILVEHE